MKTKHSIIIGDSRRMDEVKDESVHLIITSPPYWQLKDYGSGNQIGFNDSYEEYINNLNLVWNECHRVLHKGCRLCINIGDQFARSVYYGRYKVIPIRTEIIKFCETIGFDYMGAIIWQKVTTCNTTGGATVMGSYPFPRSGILKIDYEFILILKKYGKQPRVSKKTKERSRLTKKEWNKYFTGHWNFSGEKQDKHLAMFPEELPKRLIKMFSFVGDTVLDPFLGSGTTSLAAANLKRNSVGYEVNEDFLPIIKEKLKIEKGEIFDEAVFEVINGKKKKGSYNKEIEKLPYVFVDPIKFDKKINPKKLRFGSKIDLPAPCQKYYYIYAIKCENDSIYIGQTEDIEKRWREHLKGKISWTKKYKPLAVIHYEEFKTREEALERERMLKTGFGRKWLKNEMLKGNLRPWNKNAARQAGDSDYDREKYFKVKGIISPDLLLLNNGLRIRLLGVKEKREKNGEAIQYLREKVLGKKVFMKFDDVKYDDKNNLLCYLYLKNKTFINAHLIKKGLTDVDVKRDYRYKSKFLTY
jgi:DNA modification methylase/predicted GIY-YIG superfamily endonuclease